MNILVVGSGGREDAFVWKLAQSPRVEKIFCAPGNAGIGKRAECINISVNDNDALLQFAKNNNIELTVVGPEIPLVNGIVDHFEHAGCRIFGSRKNAAEIEGSKAFAKNLMKKYNIPTAYYEIFNNAGNAKAYIHEKGAPIVIKASGLAAGKGAIVCRTLDEALNAVDLVMVQKAFGEAGNQIVIEEYLTGEEASVLAITDGETICPLVPSQDHKQVFDGDKGKNTGGMGAYAPAPIVDNSMMKQIQKLVLEPTIKGMASEGRFYKGVLYAGLMITNEGPKVIEFNCRFGDPETQVVLPLIKTDLVEIMLAVCENRLAEISIEHYNRSTVCVVMASGGYPDSYDKDKEITGLNDAEENENIVVFHAGTDFRDGKIITSGGRVLGVTGLGDNLKSTIEDTYEAVKKIHFEDAHYRSDIGHRALARLR